MSKEEKVFNYYVLCNKLKNIIRTGWKDWKVNRERLESIAEHIYGVQMLAIAMKSEYEYDLDMFKVIFMLAIHELGETRIKDYNPNGRNQSEEEARKIDGSIKFILESYEIPYTVLPGVAESVDLMIKDIVEYLDKFGGDK